MGKGMEWNGKGVGKLREIVANVHVFQIPLDVQEQ